MSALVITDAGISLQSFNELREDLKRSWILTFGNSIDLSPTSVDGHHIDLECKTIISVSQLIEAVINNLDPEKASGVWLDILGDYKAMTRLKASYSKASVTFVGSDGTTVPAGTVVKYDGSPCNFTLTESITIGSSGSEVGVCQANAIGYVEVFVGDWKMVSSSPSGVTCKVEQANAGGAGRNDETDAEYRARQKLYIGSGLATYDKMYAYMASYLGVGNFSLNVNDEDTEQEGIPPHRFVFVIKNGLGENNDIAQTIWNCKPAGIKPYGNASGEATDAAGMKHVMYFSRPTVEKLWVSVSITEYTEESLPDNYEDAIKAAVSEFAASEFSPGKDIIPKRFYGPIYKAVPGILDIVVKVCVKDTQPNPSDYSESVIAVDPQTEAVLQSTVVDLSNE